MDMEVPLTGLSKELRMEMEFTDSLAHGAVAFMASGGSPLSSLRMGTRPDSLAERCLERKNLSLFRQHLEGLKRQRALVVAAGLGREGHLLLQAGFSEVHLLDLSVCGPEHAASVLGRVYPDAKVVPLTGNMERLPYGNEVFDAVMVYQGLHHLPDQAAGIREFIRVLKPGGGLFVLSEPASLPGFMGRLMSLMHWRTEVGEMDTDRVDPQALVQVMGDGLSIRYERIWQYFPRCLAGLSNSPAFLSSWFAGLELLDRFLPSCLAHTVNMVFRKVG